MSRSSRYVYQQTALKTRGVQRTRTSRHCEVYKSHPPVNMKRWFVVSPKTALAPIHPHQHKGLFLQEEWVGIECKSCMTACTVLFYIVLHCTALHRTAPHCTALHRTAPHCTALHCTALHRTALHRTALHCTVHIQVQVMYTYGTVLY